MLVKIAARLLNADEIEAIYPSEYTDNREITHNRIIVKMKSGNLYVHKAKEETIYHKVDDEINSIYENIERKRRGE